MSKRLLSLRPRQHFHMDIDGLGHCRQPETSGGCPSFPLRVETPGSGSAKLCEAKWPKEWDQGLPVTCRWRRQKPVGDAPFTVPPPTTWPNPLSSLTQTD